MLVKRIVTALVLAAFAATIPACNTMKGAGKDVERGGEKLQDASGK